MPLRDASTLTQAGAFAVLALLVTLLANALHPHGLELTRDYFPAGGEAPAGGGLPEHSFGTIDWTELSDIAEFARGERPDVMLLDARSAGAYGVAHLPGAWHVDPYRVEDTLPALLPELQREDLFYIVVYCRGGDCEDSLSLAHELVYRRGLPLEVVRVYEGGVLDWAANGGPLVSGAERDGPAVDPAAWADPEGDAAQSGGGSGEPLALAFPLAALLLAWALRPGLRPRLLPVLAWAAAAVLAVFAAAKLGDPAVFLKAVHGYGVLPLDPPWLLNLAGAGVPWMEVLAVLCLVSGLLRRGAAAVLGGFLALFTVTILWRAVDEAGGGFLTYAFDCGCGTGVVVVWQKVLSNLVLFGTLALVARRRN